MVKNKYLLKLAINISEDVTKISYIYQELLNIKNSLLKGTYYTGVKTVSRSGMSRTIFMGYIKNNKFYKIYNPEIKKLAGVNKYDRIQGVGMDMLFAAQYNLFIKLCPNHKYQTSMKQYNIL